MHWSKVLPSASFIALLLTACGYGSFSGEPATLEITSADTELTVGDTATWTAVGVADGLNWTSSDPAVATVGADGVVTALTTGTADISVAAADAPRRSDTATVTVTARTVVSLDDPADLNPAFTPPDDRTAADYDVARFAILDTGDAWVFDITRHGNAGGSLPPRTVLYTEPTSSPPSSAFFDPFCVTPGTVFLVAITIERLEDTDGSLLDPQLFLYRGQSLQTINVTGIASDRAYRVSVPKAELSDFALDASVKVETLYDVGTYAYDTAANTVTNIFINGGVGSGELRMDCIPGGEALIQDD